MAVACSCAPSLCLCPCPAPYRMHTAARWEEERGSQGNKSFCRLHSEPDGSVGPLVGVLRSAHLHPTLFYLVTHWRNTVFLLKKSHQPLSLFLCSGIESLNHRFVFSSQAMNSSVLAATVFKTSYLENWRKGKGMQPGKPWC